jgi:hypothetical protein
MRSLYTLYNEKTDEWSIYWSAAGSGAFSIPTRGRFENGVGLFYDQKILTVAGSSYVFVGPTKARRCVAGSKPSRRTTARRGRTIGSWTSAV